MNNSPIHLTILTSFLLSERNYPSQAITFSQVGDEHFRPEIALIDPETQQVLAFIEHEAADDSNIRSRISKDYRSFVKRSNLSTPIYLFTPSEHSNDNIAIFTLDSAGKWSPIRNEDFPSFKTLVDGNRAQQKIQLAKVETRREKSLDWLSIWSICVAAILFAIFIYSWYWDKPVSKEQVALLAGAAVTLLSPFYAKIRVFGIELERRRTSANSGT